MSATPQHRVESDLRVALKAGEKERLSTLRMLLADLKNERIKRGAELDDAAFAAVLRRGMKQRQDAAAQYRAGGRAELAAKEEREAATLESYLPRQASEAEIRAAVEELVAREGLQGPAAIGPAMKAMMARFAGTADGGAINRVVKQVLAK